MRLGRYTTILAAATGVVGSTIGCQSPSDVVFEEPPPPPVADSLGVFRITYGDGPDLARGFTTDGRVIVRVRDLIPFASDWLLVSVPVGSGQSREEAGPYRRALVGNGEVGTLVTDGSRRILAIWKPPTQGVHGCPDSSTWTSDRAFGTAPKPPTVLGLTLYDLPQDDGTAIPNLRSRYISANAVFGGGTLNQRVRVTPALRQVRDLGVNPFGPVLVPGSEDLIYSDGERLWRAALSDAVPELLGDGSFPALSPDGRLLASARPVGLDSTTTTWVVPVGGPLPAFCVQEHVVMSAAGWEVVIRDLTTGEERVIADGLEPAFDPMEPRVLVRTTELTWVDLESGAREPVVGTANAFAPVLSPEGAFLAFSKITWLENSDVYFVNLAR